MNNISIKNIIDQYIENVCAKTDTIEDYKELPFGRKITDKRGKVNYIFWNEVTKNIDGFSEED